MKFPALALLPLLAAACATGGAPAPRSAESADRSAVAAACRTQAERVVNYRDRGQTMRHDDYNARVGTTSYLGPQVITDQIAQTYERDRMAAECVRGANNQRPDPGATGRGLSGR